MTVIRRYIREGFAVMDAYQELETRVREKSNHPIRYRVTQVNRVLQVRIALLAMLPKLLLGLFR